MADPKTDILARLRGEEHWLSEWDISPWALNLMLEAANEIERQRKELRKWLRGEVDLNG